MVSTVVPCLADPKRRVRQAALELLAIVAANVPGRTAKMIYAEVDKMGEDGGGLSSYDDPEEVAAAVQGRLSRKQLAT